MRSWLNLKKTSYFDRFKSREDEEMITKTSLEEVLKKIVSKAEFLVAMKNPSVRFRTDDAKEDPIVK
jgi:hypothetical protein